MLFRSLALPAVWHATPPPPHPPQLREEDFDGPLLVPWGDPHLAPILGIDIHPDLMVAVTAAADGTLALTPLDAPGGGGGSSQGSSRQLWACGGAVSFTAARWAGPAGVVTASLQGRLQQWDLRQGGGSKGPALEVAAAGGQALTCLDIHPAQSYSCAAGDATW